MGEAARKGTAMNQHHQYLVRCETCGQTPGTRWRSTFSQALRQARDFGWDTSGRIVCKDCLNDEQWERDRGRSCRDGCHERGER